MPGFAPRRQRGPRNGSGLFESAIFSLRRRGPPRLVPQPRRDLRHEASRRNERVAAAADSGRSSQSDPATTGPRAGRRCGAPPGRRRRPSRSGAPRSTAGTCRSRGTRRPPGASPGYTPGPCRRGRGRSPGLKRSGRPRPGNRSRTLPPAGCSAGRHDRPALTRSRAAPRDPSAYRAPAVHPPRPRPDRRPSGSGTAPGRAPRTVSGPRRASRRSRAGGSPSPRGCWSARGLDADRRAN